MPEKVCSFNLSHSVSTLTGHSGALCSCAILFLRRWEKDCMAASYDTALHWVLLKTIFSLACLTVSHFCPSIVVKYPKTWRWMFWKFKSVGFLKSSEKLKMLDVFLKDVRLTSNFVNTHFFWSNRYVSIFSVHNEIFWSLSWPKLEIEAPGDK